MTKATLNELKELDKLAKKIERKKQKLEEQMKADKETAQWFDQVLKESGFKRPRDFIKALMEHFGMRTVSLGGTKRGPGRPATKDTAVKSKPAGKRKRTKITAEVRDKVKAMLAKGTSKNAISKSTGISYIVIKKIGDGAYDKI